MRALLKLSRGDMRRALNILQSCASAYDLVTSEAVHATTGAPLPSDVEQIVTWLLNEPFATAFQRACSCYSTCRQQHVARTQLTPSAATAAPGYARPQAHCN